VTGPDTFREPPGEHGTPGDGTRADAEAAFPLPTVESVPRPAADEPPERDTPAEPPSRRRGRRKGAYLAVAVLVVAVAVGAVAVAARDRGDKGGGTAKTPAITTATITRGDVVDTETVDGDLTYGNARGVPANGNGTVTWLPREGSDIGRGEALYAVDDKPVALFYGSLPLYRNLKEGDNGPDVEELERNLKALGYGDGLTVDRTFSAATTAAVKAWQKHQGLARTGVVDSTQVIFETGPVRVADVALTKGQAIGGAAGAGGGKAMTVTDTTSIVHVDLDTSKEDLVKKGDTVTVELPSGGNARGTITSISSVARPGKNNTTTVGVDITLKKKEVGDIDEAPVSVKLVSERAKNVLSVPIQALLGLAEGGFGIQVVTGHTSHIVPIRTGTYGGGRVEVVGTGLRAGMKVGVPTS
jgi:peptidoglycan hydrolase-like protein with peptidoglycan-binding domain